MWLVPQLWFGCVVLFSSAFIKAVDGFSKLPNGDGSNSLTGTVGTLRRYVHDWIETAPTTVQVCDAACQTKKKILRDKIVHEFGPIEDWDLSGVTNMGNVFYGVESGYFQSFNADISKWKMGAVTHMDNSKYSLKKIVLFCCFASTSTKSFFFLLPFPPLLCVAFTHAKSFNGDISKWDTSSVTTMYASK